MIKLHTREIKAMLEYIRTRTESCKTADECRELIDRAIELCGAHNIEQLREEFGII